MHNTGKQEQLTWLSFTEGSFTSAGEAMSSHNHPASTQKMLKMFNAPERVENPSVNPATGVARKRTQGTS